MYDKNLMHVLLEVAEEFTVGESGIDDDAVDSDGLEEHDQAMAVDS